MNTNNKILKSFLFGGIIASVLSLFMFHRKRHSSVVEIPMHTLRRGNCMLRSGTRSALRTAKRGIRVLNR